jgi:hypothetical protein
MTFNKAMSDKVTGETVEFWDEEGNRFEVPLIFYEMPEHVVLIEVDRCEPFDNEDIPAGVRAPSA